jgi:hypothetical protein
MVILENNERNMMCPNEPPPAGSQQLPPLHPTSTSVSKVLPSCASEFQALDCPFCVAAVARSLLHAEQIDIEDQHGARRNDATGAARAIAQVRRNDQRALAADMHSGEAFIPALDDLALAEREGKRLAPVERAVELLALLAVDEQPARVIDTVTVWPVCGTGPVPGFTSMMRSPLGVVTSPAAWAGLELDGTVASVRRTADIKIR